MENSLSIKEVMNNFLSEYRSKITKISRVIFRLDSCSSLKNTTTVKVETMSFLFKCKPNKRPQAKCPPTCEMSVCGEYAYNMYVIMFVLCL